MWSYVKIVDTFIFNQLQSEPDSEFKDICLFKRDHL